MTPAPFISCKLSALRDSAPSNHLKWVGGITPYTCLFLFPITKGLDESLIRRCLQWELGWTGSQPELLPWCDRELNPHLQNPQLKLSHKTILQPLFCSLHLAELLHVWRHLDSGSSRASPAHRVPGETVMLQIPLASKHTAGLKSGLRLLIFPFIC